MTTADWITIASISLTVIGGMAAFFLGLYSEIKVNTELTRANTRDIAELKLMFREVVTYVRKNGDNKHA